MMRPHGFSRPVRSKKIEEFINEFVFYKLLLINICALENKHQLITKNIIR